MHGAKVLSRSKKGGLRLKVRSWGHAWTSKSQLSMNQPRSQGETPNILRAVDLEVAYGFALQTLCLGIDMAFVATPRWF